MRFSSSVFYESIVHRPLKYPQNNFEKYFFIAEIFAKIGFFLSNFQVTGCTISEYFNLEVAQPPRYNIRTLHNLRIL